MNKIRLGWLIVGVMAAVGLAGLAAKGRQMERVDIGPSHAARQARPAMLGVSGGNLKDRVGNQVSGGTIGALMHDKKGNLYVLGNSHILGCLNKAKSGDPIIQPSLVDEDPASTQTQADAVARLTKYTKIRFNKGKKMPPNLADAAIAAIIPGMIRPDGYILDIGVPSTRTLRPRPGKPVRKSGRGTGFTQSTIAATDVAVDVSFSNNTVSHFKKQFLINSGGFAGAGDGGALVVDDVTNSPRVVGLLFGGNSSYVVATPIDEVMRQLGVSLGGVKVSQKSWGDGRQAYPNFELNSAVEPDSVVEPDDAIRQDSAVAYAAAVKDRFDDKLLAIGNVVGHGVSLDRFGRPVIEVYLKSDRYLTRSKIPSRLGNVPTRVVVTGAFNGF